MGIGADTADTLHEEPGIFGITPFKDIFQAAIHLAGRPCFSDFSSIYLDIYSQVTLNAGYRINGNSFTHMFSSLG